MITIPKIARPKIVTLLPPVVMAALACGYLALTGGFAEPSSAEAPRLYGTWALVLSLLLIGLSFFPSVKRVKTPGAAIQPPPKSEAGDVVRAMQMLLMVALLVGATFVLGFYVAIGLFLVLFLRFLAGVGTVKSVGAGVAVVAMVWLFLRFLLKMEVYSGLIEWPHIG